MAVLAVFSHVYLQEKLRGKEWAGVVASVVGTVGIGITSEVGPGRYGCPRHPTHFERSCLHLNVTKRRGERYLPDPMPAESIQRTLNPHLFCVGCHPMTRRALPARTLV